MVAIGLAFIGVILSSGSVTAGPSQQATSRWAVLRQERAAIAAAWALPSLTLFQGASSVAKQTTAKKELLDAIAPLQRGLTASEEDMTAVDRLARKLERINPYPKPVASPLINGKWELLYTTSASILGKSVVPILRPSGPIYQDIDAPGLRASNSQHVEPIPLLKIPFSVSAALTPKSASTVGVKFLQFTLGPIKYKAPDRMVSSLDITYLDEEMRISRGDRGNLFVLVRAAGMKPQSS